MNKTKIALTIAKLLGIAALLAIALTITILIEGLQLIASLIQELNENKPKVIPVLEAAKPTKPIKPTIQYSITHLPVVTEYLPNKSWMIDLLPKEYLDTKHLKAFAKNLGIRNYSKLGRVKLLAAING
jgi:hypothetical protein